ncbi:lanthionine synthetase C family protein [Streptomyces sp. NPDC006355]|uniref:lanthionine synthetase C family protein n=1 Tax=Streptomyces sp. NPDC006355 TaxID=3156758 RepID=UPI0033BA0951
MKELRASAGNLADSIATELIRPSQISWAGSNNKDDLRRLSGFSHGYSGIAVLYFSRSQDPASIEIGHSYLQSAASLLQSHLHDSPGIYATVEGLAMALQLAQHATEGEYEADLAAIDRLVSRRVRFLTDAASAEAVGPHLRFDVISGLAGIGRYLLLAGSRCESDLQVVLDAISGMTHRTSYRGHEVPRFWSNFPPSPSLPEGSEIRQSGHLNTGVAHGIAGPLALLSIAGLQGVLTSKHWAALECLADLVVSIAQEDEYGIYWPNYFSLSEWRGSMSPPSRGRTAWCYGTPGISRALALASQAMDRVELMDVAERSISSVIKVPMDQWGVDHWSICHGWAGIMHTLSYFQHGEIGPIVQRVIDEIAGKAISCFSDGLPNFRVRLDGSGTDVAGYLEGAAGLALALDEYAGRPKQINWDAPLLLA